MSDTFTIPNWREFQHYKDRNPPWIKLHYEILTSRTWVSLDDRSRVLAIACMLAASRNDGKVPNDPAYIQRVAYLHKLPDFAPLIDVGFLVPDAPLASPSNPLLTETETETETLATCKHPLALASTQAQTVKYKGLTRPSTVKLEYGELGKVRLTESEHLKIVERESEQRTAKAIEVLDGYIGSKGKRYASHYAVLKASGWVFDRVDEIDAKSSDVGNALPGYVQISNEEAERRVQAAERLDRAAEATE